MKKNRIVGLMFMAYSAAIVGAAGRPGNPREQVLLKLTVLHTPDSEKKVTLTPEQIATYLPGGVQKGSFPRRDEKLKGLPSGKYYVLTAPAGELSKIQKNAIVQMKDHEMLDDSSNVLKGLFD